MLKNEKILNKWVKYFENKYEINMEDYVNYIAIPKGTKILYIEGVTSTRWEYEVLLDKNIDLDLIHEESEYLMHWKLL